MQGDADNRPLSRGSSEFITFHINGRIQLDARRRERRFRVRIKEGTKPSSATGASQDGADRTRGGERGPVCERRNVSRMTAQVRACIAGSVFRLTFLVP